MDLDLGRGTVRRFGGLDVYVPAAASGPGAQQLRFPAVVWLGPLDTTLTSAVDDAVAPRRIAPVGLVAAGRGGADDARDRALAARPQLPVRADRAAWGIAADGNGACPLAAALRSPDRFAAAAGPLCDLGRSPTSAAPGALSLLGTVAAYSAGNADPDATLARAAAGVTAPATFTGYVVAAGASRPAAVLDWLGTRLPGPVRDTADTRDTDVPA